VCLPDEGRFNLLIPRMGGLAAGTFCGASCAVAGFDVETFPGGGDPSAVKLDFSSASVASAGGGVRVALTISIPLLSKPSGARSGWLAPGTRHRFGAKLRVQARCDAHVRIDHTSVDIALGLCNHGVGRHGSAAGRFVALVRQRQVPAPRHG
jgi:hypothetical protein